MPTKFADFTWMLILLLAALGVGGAGCGSSSKATSTSDATLDQGDGTTTADSLAQDGVPAFDLSVVDTSADAVPGDAKGTEDVQSLDQLGADSSSDDGNGATDGNANPDGSAAADSDDATETDVGGGFVPDDWAQCKTSTDCKKVSADSFCNTNFPGGQCSCTNTDSCNTLGGTSVTFVCNVVGVCIPERDIDGNCPPWLDTTVTHELGDTDSLYEVCGVRFGCNLSSDECAPYACVEFDETKNVCR
ncbi:MAG: hypothetical protein KC609_09675 [Myxococcales bacterium]|nr:hypothetical protein [Myxococcales bacterium]